MRKGLSHAPVRTARCDNRRKEARTGALGAPRKALALHLQGRSSAATVLENGLPESLQGNKGKSRRDAGLVHGGYCVQVCPRAEGRTFAERRGAVLGSQGRTALLGADIYEARASRMGGRRRRCGQNSSGPRRAPS